MLQPIELHKFKQSCRGNTAVTGNLTYWHSILCIYGGIIFMKPGNGVTEGAEHPVENKPPPRQLIPEKGEEYLRESANIEDLPGPAEEAGAEKDSE